MLTCQCGVKAFPGGGGPRGFTHHQLDLSLELSAYTGGSHNQTEQVRLMVRTVPQHRQSSWGEGVVQLKNSEPASGPERLWTLGEDPSSMLQH